MLISAPGKGAGLTVVMGVNDDDYDPQRHDVISALVSRDIIGDPASCVFGSALTQAPGTLVKVPGWYDNEQACSRRLAGLAALVGASLR